MRKAVQTRTPQPRTGLIDTTVDTVETGLDTIRTNLDTINKTSKLLGTVLDTALVMTKEIYATTYFDAVDNLMDRGATKEEAMAMLVV